MRAFAAETAPDWVPDVRFDAPSAWGPATGRLRHAYATGDADVRFTAVPLWVHGRVRGTPVRAALLIAADRRLADHDTATIADGLELAQAPPRVVARIDLPLGPALRVRTRIRSSATGPQQAVVQYVTPVVRRCRLVVSMVTGDLAYEQQFADTLDRIVLSMTLG